MKNQLFPDVSFERRPKIKERKKINLIELFPNISGERPAKSKLKNNIAQLFPDISGELRSKMGLDQRKLKSSSKNTRSLLSSKTFQWLMIMLILSATIYLYFNTFTLDL